MLDNMLDDISNPVAFASAPMGIEPGTSIQREFEGRTETREKVYSSKGKGKSAGKSRWRQRLTWD
jgi:hypothetical protein